MAGCNYHANSALTILGTFCGPAVVREALDYRPSEVGQGASVVSTVSARQASSWATPPPSSSVRGGFYPAAPPTPATVHPGAPQCRHLGLVQGVGGVPHLLPCGSGLDVGVVSTVTTEPSG
jgi:hypothetical protein